jgi:hypothetical protein
VHPAARAVLLAVTLVILAAAGVALPLAVIGAAVVALAVPMSALVAWMSAGDRRPPDEPDASVQESDGRLELAEGLPAQALPRPRRPARAEEPDDGRSGQSPLRS